MILILLLFFCSGATALVYEVLWAKHLSLMFGSTIQAQALVLAVFMGGLAAGNRLAGIWADRWRWPLKMYGFLEIGIALYACFFPKWFEWTDRILVGVGPWLAGRGLLFLLFNCALGAGLLLVPTTLMGATLPFLAGWLERQGVDSGRRIARFYALNSLGAVLGAWLAGFWLVRALGLDASIRMAALLNGLVGAAAVLMGSREQLDPATAQNQSIPGRDAVSAALRRGCWIVAFSGAMAMSLEVLAARALALITGGSLQAFALVLMAFILGIGLGSSMIASPRLRLARGLAGTAVLLLAAAVWVGGLAICIEYWVEVYRKARVGLARNEAGYVYHQCLVGILAMGVLGLPAGMLGAILPLWIRTISKESTVLGFAVGRLLTWNTLGAVFGSLAAGFVIMPFLGLRGAFGFVAFGLCLVALGLARLDRNRKLQSMAVGSGVVLGLGFLLGGEEWRLTLGSGVYRAREKAYEPAAVARYKQTHRLLFYEDAPDATVAVEETLVPGRESGTLSLRINGKTDASTTADLSTQMLLAHLPMIHRPNSQDAFVLGLGSGITAGTLLAYPDVRIVVAENCEPVLRAARFFAPWNRDVLDSPRINLQRQDGRMVLKLSPQKYDVIISEPSNPWTAGVGSVFSQEFFRLAADRLKPGGLMVQWFHVYEMNDPIVAMILRTFHSVFPHFEIWDTAYGDIVLIGSLSPWDLDRASVDKVFALESPADDLRTLGVGRLPLLLARQLASQRTAYAIAGPGPIQSDLFPILEYEAPKAFYVGEAASLLQGFDERTVQSALAPEDKRACLAELGPVELKAIFGPFRSVNPQIMQYLEWYGEISRKEIQYAAPLSQHSLPTIFRPPDIPFQMMPLADGSTREELILWEAERSLYESPEQTEQALGVIQSVLQSWQGGSLPKKLETAAPRYAGLAARTCFRQNNLPQAAEFVKLGLKLAPTDPYLSYYQRVLEGNR
ncbi:MAG TPA: fused MFS/spermidine synthase [Verrucomicrobiota bacterium]|nr:fused MFS/spermidine synthase [Verrucomicrobiota bacterium]